MIHVHAEVEKSINDVVVVREPFEIAGFVVNAVESRMRYRGRPDLALICAKDPNMATGAGVFTKNIFAAAPVKICRDHTKRSHGRIKAVLINAGIANACTGEEGLNRAIKSAHMVAQELGVEEASILLASTGVIGPNIDLKPIEAKLPELVEGLTPKKWEMVARAIMTTDTRPKIACAEAPIDGSIIRVGGVAKGSGMIAPNMATMLSFICTDAAIDYRLLVDILNDVVRKTFNAITVDGDTSTNDTVIVLASGYHNTSPIEKSYTDRVDSFSRLLNAVCKDLARQIVEDGEGATKCVEIRVIGTSFHEDAFRIAKVIAESPLVKTALYGGDANWGRIIAAAGRAGVHFNPDRVSLYFNDVCVFLHGTPITDEKVEEKATRVFARPTFTIRLDIQSGTQEASVWTCDLTHGYIDINAHYRT